MEPGSSTIHSSPEIGSASCQFVSGCHCAITGSAGDCAQVLKSGSGTVMAGISQPLLVQGLADAAQLRDVSAVLGSQARTSAALTAPAGTPRCWALAYTSHSPVAIRSAEVRPNMVKCSVSQFGAHSSRRAGERLRGVHLAWLAGPRGYILTPVDCLWWTLGDRCGMRCSPRSWQG